MKNCSVLVQSFLLIITITFYACKEKKNCGNLVCSEVFASVSMSVKYADNSPVSLDSFKVVRKPENSRFDNPPSVTDFALMQSSGNYIIVNDNRKFELSNKKINVVFYGYKNGIELFNKPLTIGADCCHVQLYEGENAIILNK